MDITFNNFSGKLPGKYFTNWERYIKHGEQETESKFIEKGFHAQMGNVYYQDRMTVINKGLLLGFCDSNNMWLKKSNQLNKDMFLCYFLGGFYAWFS